MAVERRSFGYVIVCLYGTLRYNRGCEKYMIAHGLAFRTMGKVEMR